MIDMGRRTVTHWYPQDPTQVNSVKVVQFKTKGSLGWLIFWILVFLPAAIFYYLQRDWTHSKQQLVHHQQQLGETLSNMQPIQVNRIDVQGNYVEDRSIATKRLQDMDSLKREVDELKYNQLKQEMGRLSSEMKKEKQAINISVERIGDTIRDSVVSGYNKTRKTPEKDNTDIE